MTKADLIEGVADMVGADAAVHAGAAEWEENTGMPDPVVNALALGRAIRPEVDPGACVLAAMEDARENPPRAFVSTVGLGPIEKAPAKRFTP